MISQGGLYDPLGDERRSGPFVAHLEAGFEETDQPVVVLAEVDPGELVSLPHLLAEADPGFERDAEVDRVLRVAPAASGLDEQEPELAEVDGGEPAGAAGAERALHGCQRQLG